MNTLKLSDLTEIELENIIANELPDDEKEEYDVRKNISKMLKSMDSYSKSLSESLKTLRDFYQEDKPNDYFIGKELESINSTLKKAVNKVYELGLYSGCVKKEVRKEIVGEQLIFSQDGERLHIVFPSLLPRRLKNGSPISTADIKQMYETPFYNYFCNGKHIIYSQKAVIIYTHFFSSEKEFVDHDNFQTKEITDLITSWLLLDDTPKNCAIFMDYRMGEYSHTEVDVIPFNELREYLG